MYDLIIKNGMIVDGTGAPSFPADVAVKGGVIAEVQAHLDERSAKRVADAAGFEAERVHKDAHVSSGSYERKRITALEAERT